MDKNNAHLYIPLVEALRDGELQELNGDGNWYDCPRCVLLMDPSKYRRRPKPIELWVNVYPETGPWAYESPESAARSLSDGGKTIRVREIIE